MLSNPVKNRDGQEMALATGVSVSTLSQNFFLMYMCYDSKRGQNTPILDDFLARICSFHLQMDHGSQAMLFGNVQK